MNNNNNKFTKLAAAICCVAIFTLSGCGYALSGTGSILPAEVKKIYIPPVENDTTNTNLTSILTEALQDQFEKFGVVQIVDSEALADATLKTKVLKVRHSSAASTSRTDSSLQQELVLAIGGELKRPNGEILWRNPKFTVSTTYGSTAGSVATGSASFLASGLSASDLSSIGDREVARGQEEDALEALAEQAAQRIYDDAVAPDF